METQEQKILQILENAHREAEYRREHKEHRDNEVRKAISVFNNMLGYVFRNVMADAEKRINERFDFRGEDRHRSEVIDFVESCVVSALASSVANFSSMCDIDEDFPKEAALHFLAMLQHDEAVHFVLPKKSDIENAEWVKEE